MTKADLMMQSFKNQNFECITAEDAERIITACSNEKSDHSSSDDADKWMFRDGSGFILSGQELDYALTSHADCFCMAWLGEHDLTCHYKE